MASSDIIEKKKALKQKETSESALQKEDKKNEIDDADKKKREDIQIVQVPSLGTLLFNCFFSSDYIVFTSFFLLALESYLLKKIIATVEYTNIDYKAYMEQIYMVMKLGNYKYDTIYGDTGALVYPAGHYWIFKFLRDLTIDRKEEGAFGIERISEGQVVFKALYLATMALSCIACIVKGGVYPAITFLLVLSKRLHSIYVLRMFNDCFTTLLMLLTSLLLCLIPLISRMIIEDGKKNNLSEKFYMDDATNFTFLLSTATVFIFSCAVSIKMNALLYLPAVLVILSWMNFRGKFFLVRMGFLVTFGVALQFLIGYPFIKEDIGAYFNTAFNFKRKFLYIWSINWQFIPEEIFLSDLFSSSLLILQITTLWIFINGKWLKPLRESNGNISTISLLIKMIKSAIGQDIGEKPLNIPALDGTHILYTLVTCNYIGVIFSRSLHYQFLSWYHWTIPLLLSFGLNTSREKDCLKKKILKLSFAFWWYVLHELCWNIYMPKWGSSLLLVTLNSVLLVLSYMNYKPSL